MCLVQVSQYTFAMCSYREKKSEPTEMMQLDGYTVDYIEPVSGVLCVCDLVVVVLTRRIMRGPAPLHPAAMAVQGAAPGAVAPPRALEEGAPRTRSYCAAGLPPRPVASTGPTASGWLGAVGTQRGAGPCGVPFRIQGRLP